MGRYTCIADNGIRPTANQTFQIDVYCKSLTNSHEFFFLRIDDQFVLYHEFSIFFCVQQ